MRSINSNYQSAEHQDLLSYEDQVAANWRKSGEIDLADAQIIRVREMYFIKGVLGGDENKWREELEIRGIDITLGDLDSQILHPTNELFKKYAMYKVESLKENIDYLRLMSGTSATYDKKLLRIEQLKATQDYWLNIVKHLDEEERDRLER